MKKIAIILSLVASFMMLFGIVCIVTADGPVEQVPLPAGPLLAKAPDFSTWQIIYSYAQDKDKDKAKDGADPSAPPAVIPGYLQMLPFRSITLTRTRPVWHAVIVNTGGQKIEQWCDGTYQLYEAPGVDAPTLVPKFGGGITFPDFSTVDFPDMDWISPSVYVGVQSMKGRKCMVFTHADVTAWIDLETRFPVQWQQSGQTRSFQQYAPPSSVLVLPQDMGKVSAALKHDIEILKRPL